jgi:hypothetical protein
MYNTLHSLPSFKCVINRYNEDGRLVAETCNYYTHLVVFDHCKVLLWKKSLRHERTTDDIFFVAKIHYTHRKTNIKFLEHTNPKTR